MNEFVVLSLIIILSVSVGVSPIFAQKSTPSTNWLQICRHPLVDGLIIEPCESLTSPDGYQLTDEGRRVLICLLGGSIAKLFRMSSEELSLLAPVAGCGVIGTPSQPSQPTDQSQPFRNTQNSLNLPPDTRVTDIFQVHVIEIHGNKITISIEIPNTSSRLEDTSEGNESIILPFNFYAGFAPLGTPVKICVKNLVNTRENCQNLVHDTNPELVSIVSP